MPNRIRKQVYLDQKHDRMLKRHAKGRGITEAEIIREALDRSEAGGGHRTHQTADPDAGRLLLASIRSLSARWAQARSRRSWNRQSLFDDRIDRWTKS